MFVFFHSRLNLFFSMFGFSVPLFWCYTLVQTGCKKRLLWAICICIAIYGTASLAQRTWKRFQTSPMVISMDRNKFVWNTSFPSLTVCPHKHIDDGKLAAYMKYEHRSSCDQTTEYFIDKWKLLYNSIYLILARVQKSSKLMKTSKILPNSLKNCRMQHLRITRNCPWIERSALPATTIWNCCGICRLHFGRKSTAAPIIYFYRTQSPNWAFVMR